MRRKRNKSKVSFKRDKWEIDLHGLTGNEAERKVLDCINRAALDGIEKVSFIHGHGTGKVKEVVHKTLSTLPISLRFHINAFNTGMTDVFL